MPIVNALKFGNATSDRVVVPTNSTLSDLDPWTVIIRGRLTTLTAGRSFFSKGNAVSSSRHVDVHLIGTAGEINITLDRSSVDLDYTSTSAPLAAVGSPFTLAVSFNSGAAAGSLIKGYISVAGAPFTPITFTATDGSVGFQSDSAVDVQIGAVNSNNALPGTLWEVHYLADELGLSELMTTQWRQFTRKPGKTRGLWTLAANGSNRVLDRSGFGNHGTVTGAAAVGTVFPYANPATFRSAWDVAVPAGGFFARYYYANQAINRSATY